MAERVMVAMSGGVDSSVAALLLLDKGYELAGGTIRFFDGESSDMAVKDAKEAAAALEMPHFVYDLQEIFKREVMDTFSASYIAGDTPNPCALCNRRVKFPEFLTRAENDGYPVMATGHYVRSEFDPGSGRWLLKKGKDENKDQSYFLYGLSQCIIKRSLFPLGEFTKKEVKEIARERGLKSASRSESQDVCFLPQGDYRAFIEENYGEKGNPGNFTDRDGNVLGRHRGALAYTIGQRRGLGVPAESRLYVVAKNAAENTVVLGREEDLYRKTVKVKNINPIAVKKLFDCTVEAKLRYSRTVSKARLIMTGESDAVLEFDDPQRAPTPGQSAVFYDGDTVIGGGVITF